MVVDKSQFEHAPVALVTGGAVRIGRAISLQLAKAGYTVAIQYNRSERDAAEAVAEIERQGGRAAAFQADLENHSHVTGLVQSIGACLGPLTCLINNASRFAEDTLQTTACEGWDAHLNVNLRTPVFLAQALAAQLPSGSDGNVINIVDQRVLRPNPQFFSYSVSKAALYAATATMAQALAPRIRVNAICPGPVLRSVHQTEGDFDHEWRSTLLGHGATPDEIADAVLFLLNAKSVTGQTIAVDGGQHLLWQTPDIRLP